MAQNTVKMNKKQMTAKLNEVAQQLNAKRDESTKLPIDKAGNVYAVETIELDNEVVVETNELIARVATGSKVTACCKCPKNGKVFYQVNEVEVWLERNRMMQYLGIDRVKNERESGVERQPSKDKRILALLKENPQMAYCTAAEMIDRQDAAKSDAAKSEKRMERAAKLGLTKEELEKMLASMK